MDVEFHYYINFIIANLSGFSHRASYKIAYSAQYVDDNLKEVDVYDGSGSHLYRSNISQTYDLLRGAEELEQIFKLFHFLPGDGKNKNITTPSSNTAQGILQAALDKNNPYLIGIASHAFADTFAHQNFTCNSEAHNNPFAIDHIPSYGHMYYLDLPDLMNGKWYDYRVSNDPIHNNIRFLDAALSLLKMYNCKDIWAEDVIRSLFTDIAHYPYKERIKAYKESYKSISGHVLPSYNKHLWRKESIFYHPKQKKWMAQHNFEDSHWYKFQEQIKRYINIATRVIKG